MHAETHHGIDEEGPSHPQVNQLHPAAKKPCQNSQGSVTACEALQTKGWQLWLGCEDVVWIWAMFLWISPRAGILLWDSPVLHLAGRWDHQLEGSELGNAGAFPGAVTPKSICQQQAADGAGGLAQHFLTGKVNWGACIPPCPWCG